MAAKGTYDADPQTADQPLSLIDIEPLIEVDGKPLVRNRRNALHFLSRVRATIHRANEDLRQAHDQVEKIRLEAATGRGRAPSSDPTSMLPYIPKEQLTPYFEVRQRELIQRLESEVVAAQQTHQRLQRVLTDVQHVRDQIVATPGLNDQERAALLAQLDGLPGPHDVVDPPQTPQHSPAPAPPTTPSAAPGTNQGDGQPPHGLDGLFGPSAEEDHR